MMARMSLPQPSFPEPELDQTRDPSRRPGFYFADLRALARRAATEAARTRDLSPPAPRRLISQPKIIGAALLFDLGALLASGALTYFHALGGAEPEPKFLAWGLVLTTAVALFTLRSRWSYTIRALADFPRQSLSLTLAFALAIAIWDADCVLAGAVDMDFLRRWSLNFC